MLSSLEAEQSSTRGYQAPLSCQQSCEIQMLCLPCSCAAQTPHLVCSLQFLRVLNFKDFPRRERLQAQKAPAWREPGLEYCWQQEWGWLWQVRSPEGVGHGIVSACQGEQSPVGQHIPLIKVRPDLWHSTAWKAMIFIHQMLPCMRQGWWPSFPLKASVLPGAQYQTLAGVAAKSSKSSNPPLLRQLEWHKNLPWHFAIGPERSVCQELVDFFWIMTTTFPVFQSLSVFPETQKCVNESASSSFSFRHQLLNEKVSIKFHSTQHSVNSRAWAKCRTALRGLSGSSLFTSVPAVPTHAC